MTFNDQIILALALVAMTCAVIDIWNSDNRIDWLDVAIIALALLPIVKRFGPP